MKLHPLIICAGLSVLLHLTLLGVKFDHPSPTSPPHITNRVEVGLVALTQKPDFSRPQPAALSPARPAAPRPPAPTPVAPPTPIPVPAAVVPCGQGHGPVSPPSPPQPPPLPDPGRYAANIEDQGQAEPASLRPVAAAAPRYAANPPPVYPDAARRHGWSGEVLVRVAVAADGGVTAADLATSSGYPVLDTAAVSAVRSWRFEPARRGSRAVSGEVLVPVRFRLARSSF